MAQVVYSARSLEPIERAVQFLRTENPAAALDAVAAIQSAVDCLGAHPLIGRRIDGEIRELVIILWSDWLRRTVSVCGAKG